MDPRALEAEKSSDETTSDSVLFNIFGEVCRDPPQVGQVLDPASSNPYKDVFGSLLLAMLAQPYQPSDFEPVQPGVSGVKEYAILLNAFQRALSSTRDLPTDIHNFIYWLWGTMPARKVAVSSTLR